MNLPINQPRSTDIMPWTPREMLEIASRAVGKVCRDDRRAMTLLSIDEIAAMTGTLLALGLRATLPGETPPVDILMTLKKET